MMHEMIAHGPKAALRSRRLFDSCDPDETREFISNVLQPHTLIPLGDGRKRPAYMDYIDLGATGVGALHFGEAKIKVGELVGFHLVIFCLQGQGVVNYRGRDLAIDRHQAFVCAPGERFDARFSPDCEQLVVRLDQKFMQTSIASMRVGLPSRINMCQPRLRPWLTSLNALVSDPMLLSLLSENPKIAADYQSLLVSLLMAGQDSESKEAFAVRGPVPGAVRRAEAYIMEHMTAAIRLDDIANAAGVPTRTLLHLFRQFRGISPMQYVKHLRLERARQRLARPGLGATVSEIAYDCGFSHLSRFAVDYLARYGEKPSATMQRNT